MNDHESLTRRAEILAKMADHLSRQLEVERHANDELRAFLDDDPGDDARRPAGGVLPAAGAFAAVVLVASGAALVGAALFATAS